MPPASILVIDDNRENLRLLAKVLTRQGYAVRAIPDGRLALASVQAKPPDLILLDVQMPGLDGYKVCTQLKTDERTRNIPVIFISIATQVLDKVKAFSVGGVDYITKPFQVEEVLARVETHLTLRDLQRSLLEKNAQLEQEIAERERVEKQLQQQAAKLEEANAELCQYAYVVSHDLKTPLRAIHNYVDFLRQDLEAALAGGQKAYLDGLACAVQEAEELVEDLLELSRVGRHSVPTEMIEIGAFLRELVASLDLTANAEILIASDWPTIYVEPVLLRQIFQNLIDNAIKFNDAPLKRVELGWRPVPPLSSDGDGEGAGGEGRRAYEFFVRDNGIGIDPRYHEQIFGVFERLHAREEYEGTGIGLAIVKKAASKLGGSVRVESKLDEGSTFFVALPENRKGEAE